MILLDVRAARSFYCTVLSGSYPSSHRKFPTVLHSKSVTKPRTRASLLCYLKIVSVWPYRNGSDGGNERCGFALVLSTLWTQTLGANSTCALTNHIVYVVSDHRMHLRCGVAIDYKILATLSNPKTKQVLNTVARGRAVRLRQLVTESVTQEDALQAINILKRFQLIKETEAPIDDLKTYFVTASGLQVDRMS